MAKIDAFVIPAGLKLEAGPEGVLIEHEGDIVVQPSPGQRLGRVRSRQGDVVLQGDIDVAVVEAPHGAVTARGKVRAQRVAARTAVFHGDAAVDDLDISASVELQGTTEARRVRAESVLFNGPVLTARAVQGLRSVRIARGRIAADILIAPTVLLDPSASGRVKVVESHNDLGPHAVRGCLRLGEYVEELGGNAAVFLAERELTPLPPSDTRPTAPTFPPAAPVSSPAAPAPVSPPVSVTPRAAAPRPVPPPPAVPPVIQQVRRPSHDDALDTLIDDANRETLPPRPAADPTYTQINEILERIVACYNDGDLPPAVTDLRALVERRDYVAVRDGITSSWNQLLKFHQKQGMRIQPAVTNNFNALNSLIRKMFGVAGPEANR